MTINVGTLRSAVGASSDELNLQAIVDAAKAVLDEYLEDRLVDATTSEPMVVPDATYDRAHLVVAIEMFNQDKAPNGVLNQVYDLGGGDVSSTPVRIGADPLRPAYPLLARYMPAATIG